MDVMSSTGLLFGNKPRVQARYALGERVFVSVNQFRRLSAYPGTARWERGTVVGTFAGADGPQYLVAVPAAQCRGNGNDRDYGPALAFRFDEVFGRFGDAAALAMKRPLGDSPCDWVEESDLMPFFPGRGLVPFGSKG